MTTLRALLKTRLRLSRNPPDSSPKTILPVQLTMVTPAPSRVSTVRLIVPPSRIGSMQKPNAGQVLNARTGDGESQPSQGHPWLRLRRRLLLRLELRGWCKAAVPMLAGLPLRTEQEKLA